LKKIVSSWVCSGFLQPVASFAPQIEGRTLSSLLDVSRDDDHPENNDDCRRAARFARFGDLI
jgi:hypothetical protein